MAWQFVGSTTGVGTSTGYTVSLNGTLTGGIASSPAEGDIVVVVSAFGNTASSAPAVSGNNSGAYVGVGTAIHANDTWDTECRPFYQVMGATPDTSLTITRVTNAAYGGATVVQVWRGVDTASPFIGSAQTSGTNGCVINCPSYNPAVTDSLIFAAGAGTMAATSSDYTGISGMSNFVTRKGDGSTSDCAAAMATYNYAGVAYDPAAISGGTTSTSSSWAGYTFALRMYVPPTQNLTQDSTFDESTDTFHAATVTTGAVGLTASLYTNDQTFYSPEVTASGAVQNVFPSLVTNDQTFHAPTVTATYTLTPDRYDSSNTFYAATLLSTKHLSAPTFDDSVDTFYAPTVARGAVTLTPSLFDNGTDTFYSASISASVGVTPSRYDNTQSFYAATVTAGGVTLLPARFDSTQGFYSATVVSGGASLTQGTRYENTQDFYAAVVTTGGVTLLADRFDSTQSFYAATVVPGPVSLAPSRIEASNSFFAVTVEQAAINLRPDLLANTNEFYVPTITPGGVVVSAPYFEGGQQFFAATVFQPGAAQNITFPDHVEAGWVESGWVGWPYFNAPQFFAAGVGITPQTSLSEAAIQAIAAAVWARTLPLGDAPVIAYGTHNLSSVDLDAIGHAVWSKSLP